MSTPEKIGAGILLCCEGEVLVLLRNSAHNNNTWGLPGGNADDADGNLWETAKREALEEMTVLTKRGKNQEKLYTVYISKLTCAARDSWEPLLNEEHSEWRWFKAEQLRTQSALHPVTEALLKDHWDVVKPLIGGRS